VRLRIEVPSSLIYNSLICADKGRLTPANQPTNRIEVPKIAHFSEDIELNPSESNANHHYTLPLTRMSVNRLLGAGILRNAECGKLSRGNLRKIKCGTFRKVHLIAFPHSAAEKFRISASFTVELSFDDFIWLVYSRVF